MPIQKPPRPYHRRLPELIGGTLCLDFVNTVEWRGDPENCRERLSDYRELAHWAASAGVMTRLEARDLINEAYYRQATEAETVHRAAIKLREALARLFTPPRHPEAADLELVNQTLGNAPARGALTVQDRGFAWASSDESLWHPFWPLLWDAAELLTSDRLARVRVCSAPRCGGLFLDASGNHSRRWCGRADCTRARRLYVRHRTIDRRA